MVYGREDENLNVFSGPQITGNYNSVALGQRNMNFEAPVSGGRDYNGDGFDDLVFGTEFDNRVHVIFGRDDDPASLDLDTPLAPEDGFIIEGRTEGARTGADVDFADVNNDGLADVLLTARAGGAFVVYGQAGAPALQADVDLATLTPEQGFRILGARTTITSAGDFNGDGIEDMIVTGATSAYVIYGSNDATRPDINLSALPQSEGVEITTGFTVEVTETFTGLTVVESIPGLTVDVGRFQDQSNSRLLPIGRKLVAAGDVNNDGFDDILIGSSSNQTLGLTSLFLVYGQADPTAPISLTSLDATEGVFFPSEGIESLTALGFGAAGDINNDGRDDFFTGNPNSDGNFNVFGPGRVTVYLGLPATSPVTRNGTIKDDVLFGTPFEDTLNGLGGDDVLVGRLERDVLDGGPGFDIADYRDRTTSGVTAELGAAGSFGIDDYISIEGLAGTAFSDTLIGDGNANSLFGREGSDHLQGGSGQDFLDGGDGDDYLQGGFGPDILNGGDGIDTADYSDAPASGSRLVDLQNPSINLGVAAAGDTYISIENILGSSAPDNLRGNAENNRITGGDGNDFLFGRDGNDVINGGRGADLINGGLGIDTADYGDGQGSRTVDLLNASANTGDARGDTYVRIENIAGSDNADNIRGDNAANTLFGRDGNDFLFGRGGRDTLVGGRGNDILGGGADGDNFQFRSGDGADEIRGFNTTEDRLFFIGTGLTFDDLSITNGASGAVVDYGTGTITLNNLAATNLTTDDFVFI